MKKNPYLKILIELKGGSDGERDRRYKASRRSKSRDSQFPEFSRHKPDPAPNRSLSRPKPHGHPKPQFENDFAQEIPMPKKPDPKLDPAVKKSSTLRKKAKDGAKTEEISASTFPRKATIRAQSLFENDFVSSETESPVATRVNARFVFENDFESDVKTRSNKDSQNSNRRVDYRDKKSAKSFPGNQKSLFEDDFSPTEKQDTEESNIPCIKEEPIGVEEEDSFNVNNLERNANGRKKLSKSRFSELNLKKSDSVNIFARENDPFDDDFFSCKDNGRTRGKESPKGAEIKWTEGFEDSNVRKSK